jgi:hypothetical protein
MAHRKRPVPRALAIGSSTSSLSHLEPVPSPSVAFLPEPKTPIVTFSTEQMISAFDEGFAAVERGTCTYFTAKAKDRGREAFVRKLNAIGDSMLTVKDESDEDGKSTFLNSESDRPTVRINNKRTLEEDDETVPLASSESHQEERNERGRREVMPTNASHQCRIIRVGPVPVPERSRSNASSTFIVPDREEGSNNRSGDTPMRDANTDRSSEEQRHILPGRAPEQARKRPSRQKETRMEREKRMKQEADKKILNYDSFTKRDME